MPPETAKPRILVVEDQPLVAETIASALEDAYLVIQGQDARRSMEILSSSKVDLVLLDCLLPGGHYRDVLSKADSRDIPVVLMSGDLQRASEFSDGERPFLAKPFSIEMLLETVARVLRR